MRGKFIRCTLLVTSVALLLVAVSAKTKPVLPKSYYRDISKYFSRYFPYQHLRQVPLDDTISAQAWTNYLSSLDYEHVYFLESDIEKLSAYRMELDDQVRAGKMDMAFEAFDIFRQRVEERTVFATNQLAQGFEFVSEDVYQWNRKDVPWPADREAQDKLWRQRLKNDLLRLMVPAIVATNAPEKVTGSAQTNLVEGVAGKVNAATNLLQTVAVSTPGSTNTQLTAESLADGGSLTNSPPMDPVSTVAKRYEQFNIMMQDSDSEWVLQKYMTAVASAFDPHSSYMSPSAREDFDIDMKLSLVGIGALLRAEDGAAKVISLIPGGPASSDERTHALKPGDKIIGVGQGEGVVEDVLHLPLYKIVRKIRGEKGTTVVLQVLGSTGLSTRLVDIVRDEVKLEEQAADSEVMEIEHNGRNFRLGVVDLPTFYANMRQNSEDADDYRSASHDVAELLKVMSTNGVEGVILDLRGNGGGSLREAISMTGLFIRSGPVVQVREPRKIHILPDTDESVVWRKPLVVLIDRLSASASEIVAGALQDYGRAILVGDSRTHGKGSVQTIRPLSDDPRYGSIKVTTASYYRISGGSTQLKGVTPDIIIPSVYDFMDLGESRLPNPMPWTMVAPALYEKISNVDTIVGELNARTELRRSKDPDFERYNRVLDRVKKLNDTDEVSLVLSNRVQDATAESEIDELRDAEEAMIGDGEKREKADDVVRSEALRILADLILVQGEHPSLAESADSPEKLSDMLFERVFGL